MLAGVPAITYRRQGPAWGECAQLILCLICQDLLLSLWCTRTGLRFSREPGIWEGGSVTQELLEPGRGTPTDS